METMSEHERASEALTFAATIAPYIWDKRLYKHKLAGGRMKMS